MSLDANDDFCTGHVIRYCKGPSAAQANFVQTVRRYIRRYIGTYIYTYIHTDFCYCKGSSAAQANFVQTVRRYIPRYKVHIYIHTYIQIFTCLARLFSKSTLLYLSVSWVTSDDSVQGQKNRPCNMLQISIFDIPNSLEHAESAIL